MKRVRNPVSLRSVGKGPRQQTVRTMTNVYRFLNIHRHTDKTIIILEMTILNTRNFLDNLTIVDFLRTYAYKYDFDYF